ncbi:hypothetical protein AWH48_16865 [Domibacillus aminovorans]|uniref:Uncharacterized protein n=1 Tax=Domibacillus aminovorans TaxID=29332 RepID=A0A177KZ29_9BACI|nr:hypothetical protein [Domibacillus aminovorans]OAH58669.1 hypothetical protein AWH48_16865 [Domibacillus aminovorans]
MFHVVFKQSEMSEFVPFQKNSFSEGCLLTYKYEMINRELDLTAEVEFYVVNDNGQEIYEGKMHIGSGFADHLYEHIYKKLSAMQLTEEKERKKNEILYLMEKEVPDSERLEGSIKDLPIAEQKKWGVRESEVGSTLFIQVVAVLFILVAGFGCIQAFAR